MTAPEHDVAPLSDEALERHLARTELEYTDWAKMARELLALRAAVREAEVLLREVRPLDCGAHYCRYCPAKSPDWEHGPHCPYVESQHAADRARALRLKLAARLDQPRRAE